MASIQVFSRNNLLQGHHQDGQTMISLPPISRTEISDNYAEDKAGDSKRRHGRLTTIKDFVKKQRHHKHHGTSYTWDAEKLKGENSLVVTQEFRPSSTGSQTSQSIRSKKHVSRRGEHSNGGRRSETPKGSKLKRMSYPPTEIHRKQLASSSLARVRRDINSKSCPMLCDVTMYGVDISHECIPNEDSSSLQGSHGNGIDELKSTERINGDRLIVKPKIKTKKDESANFRPPRPPSWQTLSAPQNPKEPEVKTQQRSSSRSAEMLKRIGRSKSEEIGTSGPSKSPIWQSTQPVALEMDVNTESGRRIGYSKSEGAGLHKLHETASYRPPKPPSWQTVPAEPDDIPIDTETTENKVPTTVIPSISVTNAARVDGRCVSAGSSRATKSPGKAQVDDNFDNVDKLSPDSAQASASNKTRGLRRSNIKRTRSRMIDAREIPKQDAVIPLSETQPSEFHLRETHHDNDVYLSENVERCRLWLAGLLDDGSDGLQRSRPSSYPHGAATFDVDSDNDEIVTCDLELSRDKWMYVGSPYPSSSSEEENV